MLVGSGILEHCMDVDAAFVGKRGISYIRLMLVRH
jgi:hypothetical protein